MQKLHLVGFTTDQKGLILSARRGARSGSFHVSVDDELAAAVEELREKQAEAEAERLEEAEAAARPTRVESALSVREIQARLRQGRSVVDVAKAAGVEPEWVDRFAAPVLAERAQVIALVRSTALRRARLGPSEHPIDESIRRNLADRNVTMSPEELTDAWSARQLADGRWAVRFRYRHRNRDHVLRFDLDASADGVTAVDRASGQLGYIAPSEPRPAPASAPRARPVPGPMPASVERSPAKRATVTVGFRPDDAGGPATSRAAKERERANEAMHKAARMAAAESERAAARRAKEKAAEAVRREREALAEAARKERERAAAERARAAAAKKKAAEAKKRAAERAKTRAAKQAAEQARRAEAALRAAEREEAARRKAAAAAERDQARKAAAAKKAASAKKATAKKAAAAKKATAKKAASAKKATAKKATAKKAASARKATAKKAAAVKGSTKRTGVTKAATAGPSAKTPSPRTCPATPRPTPTKATPTVVKATDAEVRAPVERLGILSEPPRDTTGDVRILGPVARSAPTVPTFRPGSVEAAGRPEVREEPRGWEPLPAPSPNGRARERPPGERRTRPLRAT